MTTPYHYEYILSIPRSSFVCLPSSSALAIGKTQALGIRWRCHGPNDCRDDSPPTRPSVRVHTGLLVPSNSVGPSAALVPAEVAPDCAAARLEPLQTCPGLETYYVLP